jgi:hypothetical protein
MSGILVSDQRAATMMGRKLSVYLSGIIGVMQARCPALENLANSGIIFKP